MKSQDDSTANDSANNMGFSKAEAQASQGFMVPARTIRAKISHYSPEVQNSLLEFYRVMTSQNWTLTHAATQIPHRGGTISVTALSQLYTGKYPSPEGISKSLAIFAETFKRRQLLGTANHIDTRLSRAISQVCEQAALWHKPAFIWGRTQEGKTSGLKNFCANWIKGPAIYFRTPASMSLSACLRLLCAKVGTTPKTLEKCRQELFSSIDENHTIVIDELHQAFTTWNRGAALQFWELLRDLHDEKRCSIILCGTTELARQMQDGAFKELLKQLSERSPFHLDTDAAKKLKIGSNAGTRRDLERIANSYGLEAPDDDRFAFLLDLITVHSLGRVFDLLIYSKERIANGRQLTWSDVDLGYTKLTDLNS